MPSRSSPTLTDAVRLSAIFLILLTCYAYFFPRWGDWNANSRFDFVMSVVDDRTVSIDRYVSNTGDYALINDHYYSDKAPGAALLGIPVYAAFERLMPSSDMGASGVHLAENGALDATLRSDGSGLEPAKLRLFLGLTVTTFFTTVVPAAVLGVIFFWVAGKFGLNTPQRVAATLLYGLATSAFPYAEAFVGHQTVAFALFAAFALVLALRNQWLGRPYIFLVGLLLGFAAITEYQASLIGSLIGLYALIGLRQPLDTLLRLISAAIPCLALLVVHDLVAFGTPLPIGYFHSVQWTDLHQTGFLSLTYPHWDALWGITFGAHRGLFFLSPYLLWALPGYIQLWRRRSYRLEFWLLLVAPAAYLFFNASSAMWQGGFAVGPRYLVPCLPFLATVAGIGIARSWRRAALRPAILVMAASSIGAIWAETIGGQSFPDYTANPLFDLSLPKLAQGDIARNAGMILGLSGWWSLVPLFAAVLILLIVLGRRFGPATAPQLTLFESPSRATGAASR